MPKAADITGKRFGRLVAIATVGSNGHGKRLWVCRCDCGESVNVPAPALLRGATRSCGCLRREVAHATGKSRKTHGKTKSATYRVWGGMHRRCRDPKVKDYARYGGRGIRVCERWKSFENFLADMGERPQGKSLDRLDNDGHYEPANCRWADAFEQCSNQRSNVWVDAFGERKTIAQWARDPRCAVSAALLCKRLRSGWEPSLALSERSIPPNLAKKRKGGKSC